jgi:hypothetical protein
MGIEDGEGVIREVGGDVSRAMEGGEMRRTEIGGDVRHEDEGGEVRRGVAGVLGEMDTERFRGEDEVKDEDRLGDLVDEGVKRSSSASSSASFSLNLRLKTALHVRSSGCVACEV